MPSLERLLSMAAIFMVVPVPFRRIRSQWKSLGLRFLIPIGTMLGIVVLAFLSPAQMEIASRLWYVLLYLYSVDPED